MNWRKFRYLLNKLVYITMFGLGSYFIYEGEVVQRFQLKRTNFAVYEEPIFEPPVMVTYIWPIKNVTLGKDFLIYVISGRSKSDHWTLLEIGDNLMKDSSVMMHLQHLYEGLSAKDELPNSFKITLKNFTVGDYVDFVFKYNFNNPTAMEGAEIRFSLRTENS